MFATEATPKVAARFHHSALRRTPFLLLRLLDAMAVHGEAQGTIPCSVFVCGMFL
jgi:hypothetical protein